MAGQKPRQGWIYAIDSHTVSLRCRLGHSHIYNLNEAGEIQCKTQACTQVLNASKVFRGEHLYIIWSINLSPNNCNQIQTFTVVPLTLQELYKGLPTVYPINATSKNGLDRNAYALVHQSCTVDVSCLQDAQGNWVGRIGQLDKGEKEAIERRLQYFLSLEETASEDWFMENASIELLQSVFEDLPDLKIDDLLW